MDKFTNIEQLKEVIRSFCNERDWDQFHPPKDLAIGISTEAAELLELFRFKSDQEILQRMKEKDFLKKVEHELADIFFFVLRFSQKNNIDLVESLNQKIELNAEKYPVSKAKGSNKKYNEE